MLAIVKATPSPQEIVETRQALKELSSSEPGQLILHIKRGERDTAMEIPGSAREPLCQVLDILAHGQTPWIVPQASEITTQEAADLLNISRPTLVKMLTEGRIPFHLIGTHRRLSLSDVLAYREARTRERMRAMTELLAEEDELGLPD